MQSTLSTVEIARCETGLSPGATHAPDRLLFLGALMEKCLPARRASFPRILPPALRLSAPTVLAWPTSLLNIHWAGSLSFRVYQKSSRTGSLELCSFYKDFIGENVTGLIRLGDDWNGCASFDPPRGTDLCQRELLARAEGQRSLFY